MQKRSCLHATINDRCLCEKSALAIGQFQTLYTRLYPRFAIAASHTNTHTCLLIVISLPILASRAENTLWLAPKLKMFCKFVVYWYYYYMRKINRLSVTVTRCGTQILIFFYFVCNMQLNWYIFKGVGYRSVWCDCTSIWKSNDSERYSDKTDLSRH